MQQNNRPRTPRPFAEQESLLRLILSAKRFKESFSMAITLQGPGFLGKRHHGRHQRWEGCLVNETYEFGISLSSIIISHNSGSSESAFPSHESTRFCMCSDDMRAAGQLVYRSKTSDQMPWSHLPIGYLTVPDLWRRHILGRWKMVLWNALLAI